MHNYKTELFDVLQDIVRRSSAISAETVENAQDAMINLRVEWEELQTRLRNRKIDGFEPAIDSIIQIGATALTMAAALQAKLFHQRQLTLVREAEEKDEPIDEDTGDKIVTFLESPTIKKKRRARTKVVITDKPVRNVKRTAAVK